MMFIGIDLAWTYKKETGICILDESGEVRYLESKVFNNQELLQLIRDHAYEGIAVAIDAPLVVKNETGSREAERALMRGRIHGHRLFAFMASRRFLINNFGEIRGEKLAGMILEAFPQMDFRLSPEPGQSTIVESFPTGICVGLFPDIAPVKYKRKSKIPYAETKGEMERLLHQLAVLEDKGTVKGLSPKLYSEGFELNKKNHKHLEDKIDAFLCAYGLFAVFQEMAEPRIFGDIPEGFIMIPVKN
ncbi:DUF429 domain-containing protein [Isachenkonia alkalipeptolytica]|uniref:DUF429 domain-containing protein n=1 Tax=Isachenkonia alkalipeptolytica TaxID=2565777 RepID=A0AA44BCX1_9CLOT|nr:DUF429 domain-containing protein [Isachenkonia alkalipeptolytica]NBG87779.1 DUF429 domain-containing protein [Isachenkonia alkalipeptolytica]